MQSSRVPPSPPDVLPSGSEPERLFLSALELIDRIVAIQAWRHALRATDVEEYSAWVKGRLIQDDYAILRRFAGRSSLKTYLTAVLINLFRDFRNARWGRWRASRPAQRLGPVAVRLEELLHRDGCTLREAAEILRGAGTPLRESELARLAAHLPVRAAVREVSLERDALPPLVDAHAFTEASANERRVVEEALHALVAALPPEDGLILRLRFWSGRSVADIARMLHIDQKTLYRRFDRLHATLRAALEARGIDRTLAAEALSEEVDW